jgi:hypothetical protein
MRQLTLLIGVLGIQACAPAPPREPAPAETALPGADVVARRQIVVAPECDRPARSVPQPMRDSLQASFARLRREQGPGRPVQDNYWLGELARDVPGRFAGLYIGSPAPPYIGRSVQGDRRVVVLLADTTNVERALAALEPHFADLSTRSARFRDAVVRKARWDFAQLLEWEHVLVPVVREVIDRRPFGGGVSVVRNRVTFSLPDSTAMRLVERRFAALDLPCDLIHLEVGGRLVPTSW